MDLTINDNEDFCLEMITMANQARQGYLRAIKFAKKGEIKNALKEIDEADKNFNKAHDVHMNLLQEEANKVGSNLDLLLIHAEDIMMSSEIIKILALELSEIYAKLTNDDKDIPLIEEKESYNLDEIATENEARSKITINNDKKD